MSIAKFCGERVEIYDSNGSYKKSFSVSIGAVSAAAQGNSIAVNYADGKVEIYDSDGTYQKTIY
jgi:hypothetical protein